LKRDVSRNLEVPVAGRPVLNALAVKIEEAGGDEVILGRIAAGDYLTTIAEDWGVSRQVVYDWIRSNEDRKKAYEHAKSLSADGLVERAAEDLEEASVVSAQSFAKDKARSEFKKWLASKRDREQYGETPPQTNVNLNLGMVHLQALRHGARVEEAEAVEILDHDEAPALDRAGPDVLSPAPDRARADERPEHGKE
jgi:predicted DNA-binding protein YlxM (UPF0122 family)